MNMTRLPKRSRLHSQVHPTIAANDAAVAEIHPGSEVHSRQVYVCCRHLIKIVYKG